ncbi:hypothetical protein I5535_15810 [Rhodobacteraceae bacterium F11138]|nr:hypothetical protein [Rhodobacteraceae bacterium F11138]
MSDAPATRQGSSIAAPVSDEDARQQLQRILSCPSFTRSAHRRAFLIHVVEETLAGDLDALRGDEIAVAVFNRGDDFDPQSDPVVRIEARRLRKDLDSYYTDVGLNDPVLIAIPKGGYRATITWRAETERSVPATPLPPGTAGTDRNKSHLPKLGTSAAAVAALAVLVIAVLSLRPVPTPPEPLGPPGLAVAPFEARSSAPEDTFFARGLSDQVVNDLQPFGTIRVFTLPEERLATTSTDLEALNNEYGIEYILTGTYRGLLDGSSGRLVTQLLRINGEVVWSRGYDIVRDAANFIAVQDRLAADIAAQLGQIYGIVAGDLTDEIGNRVAPSDETFACLLKAHEYRRTVTLELRVSVAECIETAVKRDPQNAEAWAMAGFIRRDQAVMEKHDEATRQAKLRSALEAVELAVELDPLSIAALQAHAALLQTIGDFDGAEATIRKSLDLNPNDPEALHQLGWRPAVRGRFEEGVGYIREAIARSIDPPARYYNLVAVDDLMADDYEEMLSSAEISASGGSVVGLALAAIAHTRAPSGSLQAAQAALDQLAASRSLMATSPREYMRQYGTRDDIMEKIIAGMIEAGWTRP